MKKRSTSKASKTDRARLRAKKDEEIDLSDIPEVTAEQVSDARLRFGLEDVPEGKTRVNMYLDNAIVYYFKMRAGGRGYQTLINETLAEHVRKEELETLLRRVIREEIRR